MATTSISSTAIKLTNLLKSTWQGKDGTRPELSEVIERIRQRWRLRLLLNGLFFSLAVMTALIIICAWLLNYWHFATPIVGLFRFIIIFSLLGLLWQFCLKPLGRRVSDARVALYLQEHEPTLKSIMLSAVDVSRTQSDNSPQLSSRLLEQALDASATVDYGHRVEQQKLRQALTKLGISLLVITLLVISPPAFLLNSATALLKPWTAASEYSPYEIQLTPGNIEIPRGSDQLISARIEGLDGGEVMLMTSADEGASWQQVAMAQVSEAGLYESFLFDLKQSVSYHVLAAGQQTTTYRINVVEIPAISDINLHYQFPAYTMLPAETSQGTGDISALRGTHVEVEIEPSIDIPGGALLLNNGERVELVKGENQKWTGQVIVEENSGYKVELQRASGVPVEASDEFRITALDDKSPGIAILSPGRDIKVSMVEEPLMKFRATDDQGVASMELVLSVNGGDLQRVKLIQKDEQPGANRQFNAEHTIYLEDLDLKAGDLISYYVEAVDLAPENQARSTISDLFFYQIRPFKNSYRKADQQGGGGGGGAQGGQQQGRLADQQKQFVVATFKMIRDREKYDDDTYRDNLELLSEAQSRIRDRVEAIVRRIRSRAIVKTDTRYQVITEELPKAAEAMIEVEKKLQLTEIDSALTDAQLALLHLQRADAAFKEINISLANRGGGGGGSGSSRFEDMADLFKLEMDKLRNQYENVQSGQPKSPEQAIDETLERLRELAHRQQQEVERQLKSQDQASEAGNAKQLALAKELEEMARQLERLSRTQPNPQLQQSINKMRNAAEAMRRAAASGGGGGGGTGANQARQAVADLQEAQKLLDQSRVRQFSEKVERTLRRAELTERRQEEIKREVSELEETWSEKLKSQRRQLDIHKQALRDELAKLESELSDLTTTAREQQPQANQPLKQAIRALRENRLQDRIGRTDQMVNLGQKKSAVLNEAEIKKGITEARKHIETALTNIGEQDGGGLETSLERMRALARELRLTRERTASGTATRGAATGNANRAGSGVIHPTGQVLENLAARANKLGRVLIKQGIEAGDINPVLEKINQLANGQTGEGLPAYSELHEEALAALMELEYQLRNKMDDAEQPDHLIFEPSELSDEYKDMVADYFRGLSGG